MAFQPCEQIPYLKTYGCNVENLKKAADINGDVDAQYALGYMYYYGIRVRRDIPQALAYIHAAAALGQIQAVQATQWIDQTAYPLKGQVVILHQPTFSTKPSNTDKKYKSKTVNRQK